ncbi:MAG: YicC family protein [Deltaproteobacteria bacterium]|nr:YicC family protein [Deltaproteobacteria bacterium]
MKSMTGFGRGEAALGEGRVAVEVRATNHRNMEVRLHAPKEIGSLVTEMMEVARRQVRRGRLELHVWLEGETGLRVTIDRGLARDAYRALCSLRDEIAPGEPVPLSLLASVPDLFTPVSATLGEAARLAVMAAVERAILDLDRMRQREGAALGADLASRLGTVRTICGQIESRAPEALVAHRRRLRERIDRLIADRATEIDGMRIEQEVALVADRTDVAEELTRLCSHCDQLAGLFGVDEPVGRRLDFMLQELGREANTIGAKSQDTATAHLVVDLKTEIERMREQAQNVE